MEQFLNTYQKEKIRLNAVIVFPNSYSIGMSNLGFQWVYHLLQLHPQVHCERAFADEKAIKVKTVESGREIGQFDVIFFSISFETDLLNVIRVLKSSQVEWDNRKRNSPFLIVGGIATTILPFYLKQIADVVVSGDADATIPILLEELLKRSSREGFLESLENKPGIYPYFALPSDTIPYYNRRENSLEPAHSVIITEKTEFSGRALIEVSKSCLFPCSFCLVTNAYGEYYPFPLSKILSIAEKYIGITNKLGLVAATLTNHPQFKEMIVQLNQMGFQLSFSAFRIEGLDEELLKLIIDNENKTLVIAPETASFALKKTICKMIPNEKIFSIVKTAVRLGIKRLKLYFIIGLPGEVQADLDEMIVFLKEIRSISLSFSKDFGYVPEMIVDINPLVPKPLTAFEGLPIEDIKSLKKKIAYLKNNLRGFGRTFVYGESPKNALLQYNIANHIYSLEELMAMA
jgi:radical SAM superfamily enzyme YgiQ (UPF0313 family)